jgi:hypothetical protein
MIHRTEATYRRSPTEKIFFTVAYRVEAGDVIVCHTVAEYVTFFDADGKQLDCHASEDYLEEVRHEFTHLDAYRAALRDYRQRFTSAEVV